MTLQHALARLISHPFELLIARWNWKSSLFSSTMRAILFLCANLTAGWRAATGAMMAEFLYRAFSAGFYGAITQGLREAEPAWAAAMVAMIAVPLVSHSIELTIHLLRGTPKILTSVIASVCFTAVSTLFNLYAMRRGALVVGDGSDTVGGDLKRVPRLIGGFLAAGPMLLWRALQAKTGGRSGTERLVRRQYS
jgi:hypothetical protein